jgi:hypothetical protein
MRVHGRITEIPIRVDTIVVFINGDFNVATLSSHLRDAPFGALINKLDMSILPLRHN